MARWSEIKGYEGLYLLSSDGDVIALPKTVKGRNESGAILIQRKARPIKKHLRGRDGLMYEAVTLSKDGKSKAYSVHRLVANAFLPNPHGLPEVNHKDENPLNNSVDNLEWCTRQYNIDYSKSKSIRQIKDGLTVGSFKSISEAGRQTGIGRRNINNVLCGRSKTAGGFVWKYCK